MNMSNNRKLIEDFLNEEGWVYEADEESIAIDFQAGSCLISVLILESEKNVAVYSRLPFTIEENKFSVISELLHRLNDTIINGSFVLDYNNEVIEYRTGISFVNLKLSKELFENIFMTSIVTADMNAKLIMTVLSTEISAKDAIEAAEAKEAPQTNTD